MQKIFSQIKNEWKSGVSSASVLFGALFFLFSVYVSSEATEFATEKAGTNVTDLIISNIPVYNVNFVVTELAMVFAIYLVIVSLLKPKFIPFALKSAGLFILIRSAFITLTHLGPFPTHSYINQDAFFSPLNLGSDFFFSGHTGLPYLMALVFWENKFVRNVCLIASVVFGVSVLLGHLHYSIDVFSAYFITYSIFHISQKFFSADFKISRAKAN